MSTYTEDTYEQTLLDLFEGLGYEKMHGPDIVRDEGQPVMLDILQESLKRLNPDAPEDALEEAVKQIININDGDLPHRNEKFTKMLQDGLPLNIYDPKTAQDKSYVIKLADYKDTSKTERIYQVTFFDNLLISCNRLIINSSAKRNFVKETNQKQKLLKTLICK